MPNLSRRSMYETLRDIATGLPAKSAIEIGVWRGWSTLPLLEAMQKTGGHLWSVDIQPCGRAYLNVRQSGLLPYWTFVQGCSWEWTGGPPTPWDFIFIDGDHANVAKDWDAFEPKVRTGGLLVLHDYFGGCAQVCGTCPQCLGPKTLVDTVIRPQWQRWECVTLPYGHGVTIVRKR